jgi:hypothetical protein
MASEEWDQFAREIFAMTEVDLELVNDKAEKEAKDTTRRTNMCSDRGAAFDLLKHYFTLLVKLQALLVDSEGNPLAAPNMDEAGCQRALKTGQ